jgi:branched-chain amino acid aminotransferase
MAVGRWSCGSGWHDWHLAPFADLSISPAAMVFHYGQAIFEGLKAYRQPSGGVALFRPMRHAQRFNRSARRLAMPELAPEVFVDACREVVRIDGDAVPHDAGHSLYLRPMLIATEPCLGVRPGAEYLFLVIASPVGCYFEAGVRPITVAVADDSVRAGPGGTGAAKCAGNYAASLLAKRDATARGCDEVVWLDARERRWVEELSGMNVFVVRDDGGTPTLVTPPLSDTILDGVTRSSVLRLARNLGCTAIERPLSIDEWRQGAELGTITEAFACGTAAVVAPIGRVRTTSGDFTLNDAGPGPLTLRLREELLALQEGRSADLFGWRTDVDGPNRWPLLETDRLPCPG